MSKISAEDKITMTLFAVDVLGNIKRVHEEEGHDSETCDCPRLCDLRNRDFFYNMSVLLEEDMKRGDLYSYMETAMAQLLDHGKIELGTPASKALSFVYGALSGGPQVVYDKKEGEDGEG